MLPLLWLSSPSPLPPPAATNIPQLQLQRGSGKHHDQAHSAPGGEDLPSKVLLCCPDKVVALPISGFDAPLLSSLLRNAGAATNPGLKPRQVAPGNFASGIEKRPV